MSNEGQLTFISISPGWLDSARNFLGRRADCSRCRLADNDLGCGIEPYLWSLGEGVAEDLSAEFPEVGNYSVASDTPDGRIDTIVKRGSELTVAWASHTRPGLTFLPVDPADARDEIRRGGHFVYAITPHVDTCHNYSTFSAREAAGNLFNAFYRGMPRQSPSE